MAIQAYYNLIKRAETALTKNPNRYFHKSEMTNDILYKSGSSIRQYMSRFTPWRWVVSKIVDKAVETAWNRIMPSST